MYTHGMHIHANSHTTHDTRTLTHNTYACTHTHRPVCTPFSSPGCPQGQTGLRPQAPPLLTPHRLWDPPATPGSWDKQGMDGGQPAAQPP